MESFVLNPTSVNQDLISKLCIFILSQEYNLKPIDLEFPGQQ